MSQHESKLLYTLKSCCCLSLPLPDAIAVWQFACRFENNWVSFGDERRDGSSVGASLLFVLLLVVAISCSPQRPGKAIQYYIICWVSKVDIWGSECFILGPFFQRLDQRYIKRVWKCGFVKSAAVHDHPESLDSGQIRWAGMSQTLGQFSILLWLHVGFLWTWDQDLWAFLLNNFKALRPRLFVHSSFSTWHVSLTALLLPLDHWIPTSSHRIISIYRHISNFMQIVKSRLSSELMMWFGGQSEGPTVPRPSILFLHRCYFLVIHSAFVHISRWRILTWKDKGNCSLAEITFLI